MEAIEFDHHSITTYYTEPPFDLHHHPTTAYPPPAQPSDVHVHIYFLHQTIHSFCNRPYNHDHNQNHNHDHNYNHDHDHNQNLNLNHNHNHNHNHDHNQNHNHDHNYNHDHDHNQNLNHNHNQNNDHDNENHHRSRSVLVATHHPPPVKALICIPAHTFKSYTESHRIVSQEVKELQLHPSFEDPVPNQVIANRVIATCLRVLNSVSNMGRKIVTVRINLATVEVHVREEREWVERGLAESFAEEREGGERGTVAASKAAVRGLNRMRVVKNGVEESCRVCLEEFVEGETATFMPCRHVFHEGCIETWLGTSHVCPICRFEMPIS